MKEEDEVTVASSSDTSVEENSEDDWLGTITQAPSAKAVLAQISAFQNKQNKCTIKHSFHTTAIHMKSLDIYENCITLFCLEKNLLFDNIILTQNHAWHITQSF
jgi:hypothetical protein